MIRAVTGHSAIGSATSGIVIFTDPAGVPYDHLELRDVTISGSDGGSTLDINGIYSYFTQTAAGKDADNFGGQPDIRSILRDITIVNCGRFGVWINNAAGSASTSWGLDHVRVFACGDTLSTAAGFYINGTDIWATNCDVGSQGASGSTTNIGFQCAGSDNSYIGCVAWTTKGTGFKVTGSKQRLIGCNAHHSTQDGYEVTGNRNIFDGCLSYDNARDGFRISANTCSFNACHSFDDGDSFTVTGRPQDTGFNLTNTYANSAGNWITGTTFFSGGAGTPVAGASISDPTSYVHVVHTGNHPDGTSGTREVVHYENGLYMGSGSGSPEGVVAAKVGSTYRRTDGSTSTTLYVKTSGTGNTGWTAK